jgi:hypothetical protein
MQGYAIEKKSTKSSQFLMCRAVVDALCRDVSRLVAVCRAPSRPDAPRFAQEYQLQAKPRAPTVARWGRKNIQLACGHALLFVQHAKCAASAAGPHTGLSVKARSA